jgi:hypothetical protein
MTLNMLRTSQINPNLSAYAQLFGSFDYNKTPLAPLGTNAVIHERPQQRRTFGDHGREGWYIGPAMHHYRHYTIFVTTTRGDRVSNTVAFFPTKVTMPKTSSQDRLAVAIEEITHVVTNKPHFAAPFIHMGEPINAMLAQLSDILTPATPQTPQPLQTARGVPRVQVPAPETATAPRVAAANTRVPDPSPPAPAPRVQKEPSPSTEPSTPAPAPRVQTLPITTAPTPRVGKQHRAPPSLTSHLRESNYWRPLQRRRIGRTRPTPTGYAYAIDKIEQQEYEHNNPQLLEHHAYAITDEATGEQLEYRHLLKHPKYRVIWLVSAANEFG